LADFSQAFPAEENAKLGEGMDGGAWLRAIKLYLSFW
jgi:hypothetical protein